MNKFESIKVLPRQKYSINGICVRLKKNAKRKTFISIRSIFIFKNYGIFIIKVLRELNSFDVILKSFLVSRGTIYA